MISELSFVFADGSSSGNVDEVVKRINKLLTTPKGTMPLDREYGVDYSEIIDLPPPIAQNTYVVEAAEAINKYEPGFALESIEFDADESEAGQFRGVVTLTLNDDIE